MRLVLQALVSRRRRVRLVLSSSAFRHCKGRQPAAVIEARRLGLAVHGTRRRSAQTLKVVDPAHLMRPARLEHRAASTCTASAMPGLSDASWKQGGTWLSRAPEMMRRRAAS